jgi:hypothetical protein
MSRYDDGPVVVARAENDFTGQMWCELLENNGIVAMLRVVGPLTGIADFASPHELLVAPADADRARDLLAAFDEDENSLAPPH